MPSREEELYELLDEVVELALAYGVFDDGPNDGLWERVAEMVGRDHETGNRL
jgi:hypothetical protein